MAKQKFTKIVEHEPAPATPVVRAAFNQITFAKKLNAAMKRKNITQSQLAGAVWGTRESMINGKSYTVSRNRDRLSIYLQAKGYPRPEALEKMAFLLDMTPEELCPEVAARKHEKLPPDVSVTLMDAGATGKQTATLRVNTMVSASLALKIATLIQEEHADAKAD